MKVLYIRPKAGTNKLLYILVSLSLLFAFSACSGDDDEDDAGTSSETTSLSTPSYNGYEYVDLGLSVKWAACNVGASSIDDYGNYYAWGEYVTKSAYTAASSTTYNVEGMEDISGSSRYDVARIKMGGTWRIPTYEEMRELVKYCEWTWTGDYKHYGYLITGDTGNSIFLPAGGIGAEEKNSYGNVGRGYYWTSTPGGSYDNHNKYAYSLEFSSYGYGIEKYWERYRGFLVRAVSE